MLRSLALLAALFFPLGVFAEGLSDQYVSALLPESVVEDTYAVAEVIEIISESPVVAGGISTIQQVLGMKILGGPYDGETFETVNGVIEGQNESTLKPGQRVVMERILRADGSILHLYREPYRLPSMGLLAVFFIALSVLLSGWRGIASVAGLLLSVLILFYVVVPSIAAGHDPLLVSVLGSYIIACTSLTLAHGWNRRTFSALLSTAATLALAAISAVLAVKFTYLFGMGTEESLYLATGGVGGVNLRGLLIGGFIIGALGVLDDITTAQSAAVEEISKANPSLTSAELWKAGMSVGREHIASLINTLALAYVGASLPLFLLFHANERLPTWLVLNGEFIAEEIVRTLVGSTALLLAVPISTWLAAHLLRNRSGKVLSSTGHHHHHH